MRIIAFMLLLAAGAAAFWFFVLRNSSNPIIDILGGGNSNGGSGNSNGGGGNSNEKFDFSKCTEADLGNHRPGQLVDITKISGCKLLGYVNANGAKPNDIDQALSTDNPTAALRQLYKDLIRNQHSK